MGRPHVGWQFHEWKHCEPVDAHLPRPSLVGEEDDAVGILVKAPEEREEPLEGLAHRGPRSLLGDADALGDESLELRDERLGAFGLVSEVLRVDAEALEVLAAQARVVELPDLTEQRRGSSPPLRDLVEPDHVAYERGQLRFRHDLDRPLGDHHEIAPAHPPQVDAQLVQVDGASAHRAPSSSSRPGVSRLIPISASTGVNDRPATEGGRPVRTAPSGRPSGS